MATNPIGSDAATVIRFPSPPPMPAVARILARFDRNTIEAFLAVAIDLIDTLDGDPDAEDDDPRELDDALEDDDPAEIDDGV